MDSTSSIILDVSTNKYQQVTMVMTDGYKYTCDLSAFAKVFCYPKTLSEWQKVYVDQDGIALVWASRFEVHVDQALALVIKKELFSGQQSAAP